MAQNQALVVEPATVPGLGPLIRQHQAAKAAARAARAVGNDSIGNNELLGRISEEAALLFFRSLPCDSAFAGKVNGSDNGFDILTFSPCVAQASKIRIVESKQVSSSGTISLASPNSGPQMGNQWETDNIAKLTRASPGINPNGRRMGQSMQKNYLLIDKYVSAVHNGKLIIVRLAAF